MLTKKFKLNLFKKWWLRYWVYPFEYKYLGKDLFDRTMLWNEFLKQYLETEIIWNIHTPVADPFINVSEKVSGKKSISRKYINLSTDVYQIPGQYRIYRQDKGIIFEIS